MTQSISNPSSTHSQPRSRVARWLLTLLLLSAIVVFLLPMIAGRLMQSPAGLAWLTGRPPGTVSVGEASFRWQGPVLLRNVTLQTPDGAPIAKVASLTTNQTFWSLLTQQSDPLQLQLEGIHLVVQVAEPTAPQGQLDLKELVSSIQDFEIPHPARPLEVKIHDASIEFRNPRQEIVGTWANLSGQYQYESQSQQHQQVELELPADAATGQGALQLQADWTRDTAAPYAEHMTVTSNSENVSLKPLGSWMQKYLGPDHALASCSGAWQGTLQRDAQTGWAFSASGQFFEPGNTNPAPDQVAFAEPPRPLAELELESRFAREADALEVPRLYLAADTAAVDLKGDVQEISGQQILKVMAEVSTSGSALLDLLPAEMREQIQIEGIQLSQIEISGSLFPAADGTTQPLTYSLQVGWDKALAYGLESTQGKMKVSFSEGRVRADPIDAPVSGGRLLKLPSLNVRSTPAVLEFEPGIVFENVKLTEEVCRDWLKYISPTLADATRADGRITLTMQQGEIPLGQMQQARLSGVLSIREGSVRPGPLAAEMLQPVGQLQQMVNRGGEDLTQRAFLTMKQDDIAFQMQDGRVYHQNFGANVGEVRIATAGSVGLDQTLQMQLNILLPERWQVNGRPVLQALAGQPMTLGIAGTLSDPEIDARPLADFGKQVGIKAGIGLLEKLIERRQQRGR